MASTAAERAGFAARHRHDRTMVAGVVFAIWLAIVTGFGIDLVKRANTAS